MVPALLDHLVYATPDLEPTVESVAATFGVRPLAGGAHPAWGTRNVLLPLSPVTYLEIIGPDPSAATRPQVFGLHKLARPKLVAWAAKGRGLYALVERATELGIRLGRPVQGSRRRPDGSTLSWQLTDPLEALDGGVIPFFIDWGASAHPAAAGPAQVQLVDFHGEHPDPDTTIHRLRALGLELRVDSGPLARLVATFQTPRGSVTLS